jgi:tripartite-type tricarboxylate transporter receptor subunit TctC
VPMIEKYSGARVTVLNVVGGGGTKVANQLAQTNPSKEPITIALLLSGIIYPQVTKQPGLVYDVRKFVWLSQISSQGSAFFTGAKSQYKSVGDLLKSKHFTEGSTGKGSPGTIQAILRKVALGWNSSVVAGYDTPQSLIMAVIQGEIDVASLAFPVVKVPAETKQVKILYTTEPVPPEVHASVPYLLEIPEVQRRVTDEGRKLVEIIETLSLGRAFAAAPGTPDHVRLEWDRILKQVTEDPWFKERMERTGNTPGFQNGTWVRNKVVEVHDALERYKELLK